MIAPKWQPIPPITAVERSLIELPHGVELRVSMGLLSPHVNASALGDSYAFVGVTGATMAAVQAAALTRAATICMEIIAAIDAMEGR